jgi:hypothetical protein
MDELSMKASARCSSFSACILIEFGEGLLLSALLGLSPSSLVSQLADAMI